MAISAVALTIHNCLYDVTISAVFNAVTITVNLRYFRCSDTMSGEGAELTDVINTTPHRHMIEAVREVAPRRLEGGMRSICRTKGGRDMATCSYCGSFILFGGEHYGGLRYCNTTCRDNGALLRVAGQIPDSAVRQVVQEVHGGLCPKCQGNGPVDVHTAYRVWSALVVDVMA